jgi:hypothetical protein
MDIKHLAHAWEERFENALEQVLSNSDSKTDDLIEVIWNKGILDRLVPEDKDEFCARLDDEREVFDSRDNTELYWRITYSVLYAKRAINLQWSTCGGGASVALVRGFVVACYKQRIQDFCPGYTHKNHLAGFNFLAGKIIKRAEDKLRELGAKPHEKHIEVGARGMFEGIAVYVDEYMDNGLLYLRPEKYEDIMLLYDKAGRDIGVSPGKLNPADFH